MPRDAGECAPLVVSISEASHSSCEREPSSSLTKQVLGAVSMVMVWICWVGGSEVAQALQDTENFDKPLFITYFNHSCTAMVAVLQTIYLLAMREPLIPQCMRRNKMLLLFRVAVLATIFLAGDYLWFIALGKVSVAIATTIFNTSCVFVYLLSVLFLGEKVEIRKVLAVLLAVGGVVLITSLQSDDDSGSGSGDSPTVAIILTVVSAFLYAVYELAFKVVTDEWDLKNVKDQVIAVNWVTALVSIFTLLVWWPLLAVVNVLPSHSVFYEHFELPTSSQIPALFLAASGTVGFTVFFGLSLALLSPLAVSVGTTFTIPASSVTDYFAHGKTFNAFGTVGAVLIISAFCFVCFFWMGKFWHFQKASLEGFLNFQPFDEAGIKCPWLKYLKKYQKKYR